MNLSKFTFSFRDLLGWVQVEWIAEKALFLVFIVYFKFY